MQLNIGKFKVNIYGPTLYMRRYETGFQAFGEMNSYFFYIFISMYIFTKTIENIFFFKEMQLNINMIIQR
jgi:hypothetical protein